MKDLLLKIDKHKSIHNRSQISNIMENPLRPRQVLSIAYDSILQVWNYDDLSFVNQKMIIDPYPSSIAYHDNKFYVGLGSGNIIQFNQTFQLEKEYQVHKDCVTAILFIEQKIITASHDGFIYILNKSFQKIQNIQIGLPIFQCLLHKNMIYVASNPSYAINLDSGEKKQLNHFRQFIVHQDQIYGCSDQIGIIRLRNNCKIYVPSNYMLSIQDMIVFWSEQSIGYVIFKGEYQVNWKMYFIKQMKPGFAILSALRKQDHIVAASQSGDIFKFQIKRFKQN